MYYACEGTEMEFTSAYVRRVLYLHSSTHSDGFMTKSLLIFVRIRILAFFVEPAKLRSNLYVFVTRTSLTGKLSDRTIEVAISCCIAFAMYLTTAAAAVTTSAS